MEKSKTIEFIKNEVKDVLNANNLPLYDYDVYHSDVMPITMVEVHIEDGDWKHDHLCLEYAMKEAGYISNGETDYIDSDDDSYTSMHVFFKFNDSIGNREQELRWQKFAKAFNK